jgi:hypothetical protein
LRSGSSNDYGKGIYCSPDIKVTEHYQKGSVMQKDVPPCTIDTTSGKVSFMYSFMCRVNVSRPHYCSPGGCPEAENHNYTIHFTKSKLDRNVEEWFVNYNNSHYENIRCYRIVVRRVYPSKFFSIFLSLNNCKIMFSKNFISYFKVRNNNIYGE